MEGLRGTFNDRFVSSVSCELWALRWLIAFSSPSVCFRELAALGKQHTISSTPAFNFISFLTFKIQIEELEREAQSTQAHARQSVAEAKREAQEALSR